MEEPRSIEPADDDDESARDGSRDSMFLLANLNYGGQGKIAIRVRNLSPGGLMADCPIAFERDDPVEIELRGVGELAGHVAWCRRGRIGIAFDRQIDPRVARKPVGKQKEGH